MSCTKEISLKDQLYCPIPELNTCTDCGCVVGYQHDHTGELLRDNDGKPIPDENECCQTCDQDYLAHSLLADVPGLGKTKAPVTANTSSILDETNSLMLQIFER